MSSLYERFKSWTAARQRTDIWRAVIGIVIVAIILSLLTGCSTTGPSMTVAASYEGDGVIVLKQPIFQSQIVCTPPKHEVFINYLHHSEIFKETDEDTYDGIHLGYTHNFGKWIWQKD